MGKISDLTNVIGNATHQIAVAAQELEKELGNLANQVKKADTVEAELQKTNHALDEAREELKKATNAKQAIDKQIDALKAALK